MNFKFPIFVLATILFTACSNNVDLAIDNPTSSIVTCRVDSLYVEVPPKEVVWVEMGKGEHTITLSNDSVVKMDFQKSVYMVNPSLSQYLMYESVYGNSPISSAITSKTVNFLGLEIDGNYAVIEDVVNDVLWDYGPRESLPEMIEIEAGDRPALLKLMDVNDFLERVSQYEDTEEEVESEMSGEEILD